MPECAPENVFRFKMFSHRTLVLCEYAILRTNIGETQTNIPHVFFQFPKNPRYWSSFTGLLKVTFTLSKFWGVIMNQFLSQSYAYEYDYTDQINVTKLSNKCN